MKQTYRSKTAFVLGCAWLVFVAFNVWDLTARYNGKPSMVALAVLGAMTALVYVVAIRPATVIGAEGLLARNPLRTTFLTWASIGEVTVSHSIAVRHGGEGEDERVLRLWTPMSSARERSRAQRRGAPKPARGGRFRTEPTLTKAEQAAAEVFSGKTHADFVGDQIRERAEAARRRDEPVTPARVTWSYDSIAVLAVAVALIVAAVVIA
ncbi:MAG: PH domain-containing protein [Nonomuraea sp.]|nr:PH domain-containing protein [Nonomuraea sp.]NUP79896.1 PH domain-containing protein [Nonomuraea sp.]NUS06874.1 PH domain-containing protein [Nonomuraea sp.]NUT42915.1 PH domain-containing protein [Thermoactinospora sp.]